MTLRTISAKVSDETAATFDERVRNSGLTRDEFLSKLLNENKPIKPAEKIEEEIPVQPVVKPEIPSMTIVEKHIEVEKPLAENEILISLNPAQFFALRETVLSGENFAAKQNLLIDRIHNDDRPFFYFGKLFEPEFRTLWVRYQEVTKEMTEEEKNSALKNNMGAYILNFFLCHLVEGQILESDIDASILKDFITGLNDPALK